MTLHPRLIIVNIIVVLYLEHSTNIVIQLLGDPNKLLLLWPYMHMGVLQAFIFYSAICVAHT